MRKKLFNYLFAILSIGAINAQIYCTTGLGGSCGAASITNFSITGTSLNNTSTCTTNSNFDAYTFYSASPTTSATLLLGVQYTLNITATNTPNQVKVYIDYNKNGSWNDPGEEIVVCASCTSSPNNIFSATFTVPTSAVNDTTRLRVRTRQATIADACENMGSGETEDYLVYLDPGAPCAGQPVAGTAAASNTLICPNTGTAISLSGNTIASGLTYQWQSGPSASGPFTNVPNATSGSYFTDSLNAQTYFQCVVTCTASGLSATSTVTDVNIKPFSQCYCNTNLGGSCSPNANNVLLNTLNNPSTLCNQAGFQAYTIFPDSGSFTTTLIKGVTYPLSLTVGQGPAYQITAFIDYNRDGQFNNGTERIDILPYNFNNTQTNFTIPVTIPLTADTGKLGFRIRIRASSFNDACDPLGSGETEDYTVRIIDGVPCSGTPNAGFTTVADTSVCPNSVANFTLNGSSQLSGLTYQWQLNGSNILSATNSLLSDTITGPNTYQCVVTCSNSNQSATSSPVTMVINPFLNCYCAINSSSTFGTDIGNVTVGSFTNGTASPLTGNFNAINTYSNYDTIAPIPIFSGVPNALSFTGITSSTFTAFTTLEGKVFIDYNHDGTFDPITELVITGTGNYNTATSSIISGNANVPITALTGNTGMRVMLYENSFPDACNINFGNGETEDYIVNIQAAVACAGTPAGGTATTSDSLICPNTQVTLAAQGATVNLGISYQWQISSTLAGPYVNANNANGISYITDSISSPTYLQCVVTCANSGLSATSSPIFVNTKPFSQCYCNTNLGGSCSPNANNIVLNTLNNPSTFCNNAGGQAYTIFPDTAAYLTTTLVKGATYPLSLTVGQGPAYQITAFIDYNRDGQFNNTTERIDVLPFNFNNTQTNFTIPVTVPLTADSGFTGFRIRIRASNFNDACDQLGSGETEDYTIRLIDGAPCAGTPNAGSTVANDTSVCLGSVVNLSLSGNTIASGLSFQWQENGINIPNATSTFISDTVSGPSTYQCIVTCTNSGQNATSSSVTLTINPFSQCYCPIISSSTFGTDIGNVTVGSFTNGIATPISGNINAVNTYTDYTALGPISILSGIPNNISFTGVTSSTFTSFTTLTGNVYIDYNQDGIYNQSTELAFSGTGSYSGPNTSIITGNPLIPSSALTGTTGMRVMLYESNIFNPCIAPSFAGGETEDYTVNIQPAVACSGTPTAGNAQSSDSLVCSSSSFNLSLIGALSGSGISYQWLANGLPISGDTLPVASNVSQSAITTYTCVLTCANSNLSATSGPVTVNMDTPANCACIPAFGSGCSGDEIISVSINGITNNTGTACPTAPYYTLFPTPVMSAKPGAPTVCVFEHGTVYQHYINMWIDYNDDFNFSDSERVITNLNMASNAGSVGTTFIPTTDSGFHRMRVLQNYSVAVANPQSCGTSYSYGETEDYFINISDTVTVYTSLDKQLAKSSDLSVKLYPNPTSGVLYYEIPNSTKAATILVSDVLGRQLITKKAVNAKSIDLSELKNGTYYVTFNIDGKLVQSKIILNQ
jgi:GEVED domain/Secretion system C-terminal sorting domain